MHCGVVYAANEEEAERIAWDKYGNDYTCGLEVREVTEEEFDYTVYLSEM